MEHHAPIEHYYQLADYNIAICILFPVLNVIAVSLRFFSRKKQKVALQIDDWLTIPALVLLIGSCAAMITGVYKHADGYLTPEMKRRSDLDTVNEATILVTKIEFAVDMMTIPGVTCAKLSFLFFFKRIFCPQKTGLARIYITGLILLVFLWGVGFEGAFLFSCGTHVSAWWGSAEDNQKFCPGGLRIEYALVVSDFLTDVAILLTPLPLLWKLQLKTSKKISVSLVFLLGSVAVGASIGRMIVILQIVKMGFDPTQDQNLYITGATSWLIVELGSGLLATCLPALGSLFKGMSPASVINSIRGVFTLRSNSSSMDQSYDRTKNFTQINDNASTNSKVGVLTNSRSHEEYESYAMDERRNLQAV